jgi:hypothetical protein
MASCLLLPNFVTSSTEVGQSVHISLVNYGHTHTATVTSPATERHVLRIHVLKRDSTSGCIHLSDSVWAAPLYSPWARSPHKAGGGLTLCSERLLPCPAFCPPFCFTIVFVWRLTFPIMPPLCELRFCRSNKTDEGQPSPWSVSSRRWNLCGYKSSYLICLQWHSN